METVVDQADAFVFDCSFVCYTVYQSKHLIVFGQMLKVALGVLAFC